MSTGSENESTVLDWTVKEILKELVEWKPDKDPEEDPNEI